MAVKELLELSCLLQGDDQERLELEREKHLLSTLIQQHENRLLNESESKMLLAHELDAFLDDFDFEQDNVDLTLMNINNTEAVAHQLPFLDIVERVDRYISSRSELKDDISTVRQSLSKMMHKLLAVAEESAVSRVGSLQKVHQELKAATNTQDELICKCFSTQNALKRSVHITQQHDLQLQKIISSKHLALEEFKIAFRKLSELINQLTKEESLCLTSINDHVEEQRLSKMNEDSLRKFRDDVAVLFDNSQSDHLEVSKNELESIENRCMGQISCAAAVDSKCLELQLQAEEDQIEIQELLKELESQKSIVEQQEKHKMLLNAQKNAYGTNSFQQKLGHLIKEAASLREQQEDAKELIMTLERNLTGTSDSQLVCTVDAIRNSLEKKAHAMANLRVANEMLANLLAGEKSSDHRFSSMNHDFPRRCEKVPNLLSLQTPNSQQRSSQFALTTLTGMDLGLQTILNHIKEQQHSIASLEFRNRCVQNLKAIQSEQARMTEMRREKNHRLTCLKAARIKIHMESLDYLEASLVQENNIFQQNLCTAENSLRLKKKRLLQELEQIVHLKKSVVGAKNHESLKSSKQIPTSQHRRVELEIGNMAASNVIQPKRQKTSAFSSQDENPDIDVKSKKPVAKMRSALGNSSWNSNQQK